MPELTLTGIAVELEEMRERAEYYDSERVAEELTDIRDAVCDLLAQEMAKERNCGTCRWWDGPARCALPPHLHYIPPGATTCRSWTAKEESS